MYINRYYQNYVVVCYLVVAGSVSFKGGWGRWVRVERMRGEGWEQR